MYSFPLGPFPFVCTVRYSSIKSPEIVCVFSLPVVSTHSFLDGCWLYF